jgi:hypothetical protein
VKRINYDTPHYADPSIGLAALEYNKETLFVIVGTGVAQWYRAALGVG